MTKTLSTVWKTIIDTLIPKRCLGCGREGRYICADCSLFLSEVPLAGVGSRPDITSVWEYEGIIEKAILKIKYDGYYDIVGELVEKALQKIEINLPENAVITYVPMYKKREKQRGFNQAKLIAEKIGKNINRPVIDLLEKVRDNPSQVGLGLQERQENVRGVFSIAKMTEVEHSSILLVDDVYTTGATMKECTKVLKRAEMKNVWGFTLARKLNL